MRSRSHDAHTYTHNLFTISVESSRPSETVRSSDRVIPVSHSNGETGAFSRFTQYAVVCPLTRDFNLCFASNEIIGVIRRRLQVYISRRKLADD